MLPNDAPVLVPDPARGVVRRTFGSLDTHNYRLYFGGHLVSHTGSWMQNMAEAWLVLKLTGSGVAVGATFACRFLPVLLFGLWGGAVRDAAGRAAPSAPGERTPARARGPRLRVGHPGDQGDDPAGRGGRDARLQLPDLPHAAGARHVPRRRGPRRAAHGRARPRD